MEATKLGLECIMQYMHTLTIRKGYIAVVSRILSYFSCVHRKYSRVFNSELTS